MHATLGEKKEENAGLSTLNPELELPVQSPCKTPVLAYAFK